MRAFTISASFLVMAALVVGCDDAMQPADLAAAFSEVDDGKLVLHVDVDEGSFVGPGPGVQGPFNVQGDTGSGPKTFQCWGWIFEDGATTNVSQVYNIAGRGAIMIQGQEGVPLAVVGGTGDFRNVRGQGAQVFTGSGFDFTITFDLHLPPRRR